ncbi:hypothetical protein chiPu_0024104, partial [Chiloscyllium punctatum]|nr:hypothetical protein [Chiloscyllium punctatum]
MVPLVGTPESLGHCWADKQTNLFGARELWAELPLESIVIFPVFVCSKNLNNSRSDMVPYKLEVEVEAHISTRGWFSLVRSSAPIPKEVLFATSSLKPEKEPITEEDVGPPVKYVFEVSNNGPSSISHSILHVTCPVSYQNERLLYLTEYKTVGPVLNCTVSSSLNPLQLK